MTKNDIHQPRNFDPMAYEVVDAFDAIPEEGPIAEQWLVRLLAESSTSAWHDRGLCDHCGASIRYVVVLLHTPTGDHVAMGETCVDNRIASMDRATWKVAELRKAAAARRQAARNAEAREANLRRCPILSEIVAHDGWLPRPVWEAKQAHTDGVTLTDEAIFAAYETWCHFRTEAAERAAAKAEREANAQPAPAGRVVVTGQVVSVKDQEGYMGGTTWKMLVAADDGYRVWSTVPNSIWAGVPWDHDSTQAHNLKGLRVTFTATLEPKADDPTFAFAKRPTKATVVHQTEGGTVRTR